MIPRSNGYKSGWMLKYIAPTLFAAALSIPLVGSKQAAAQDPGPGIESNAVEGAQADMRRKHMRKEFRKRRGAGEMRGGSRGKGDRLERMGSFLKFVRSYQDAVKNPHDAAGFAILAVKENYKRQGKPDEAVKYLNGLLEGTNDQHLRNIILFNLKQLYEHQHNSDKAIEISKQIVAENMKQIK